MLPSSFCCQTALSPQLSSDVYLSCSPCHLHVKKLSRLQCSSDIDRSDGSRVQYGSLKSSLSSQISSAPDQMSWLWSCLWHIPCVSSPVSPILHSLPPCLCICVVLMVLLPLFWLLTNLNTLQSIYSSALQ